MIVDDTALLSCINCWPYRNGIAEHVIIRQTFAGIWLARCLDCSMQRAAINVELRLAHALHT